MDIDMDILKDIMELGNKRLDGGIDDGIERVVRDYRIKNMGYSLNIYNKFNQDILIVYKMFEKVDYITTYWMDYITISISHVTGSKIIRYMEDQRNYDINITGDEFTQLIGIPDEYIRLHNMCIYIDKNITEGRYSILLQFKYIEEIHMILKDDKYWI